METLENCKPKIYKCVALYDSATKKTKTIRLKISDFESAEQLDAYVRKLKEDNKQKNKNHKYEKNQQRIKEALTAEPVGPKTDEIPAELMGQKIKSDISLKLDKGTGSSIVIYGASKRGKSTLMMYLYEKYFNDKNNLCTLFSGNPHLSMYKGDKNLLVCYGFGEQAQKYVQMEQYINVKTKNEYKFICLFDDVVDKKYCPIISKLVLSYRNANISSIVCLQYVYMLAKSNRSSVNHTFVFGANSMEDAKNIVDLILKPYFVEMGLKTDQARLKFFRMMTDNHGFIYIDNIRGKISFHRLAI